MSTRFDRFTHKASAEPQLRFTALMGLVFDPEGLHESFERQDGEKAPGVVYPVPLWGTQTGSRMV